MEGATTSQSLSLLSLADTDGATDRCATDSAGHTELGNACDTNDKCSSSSHRLNSDLPLTHSDKSSHATSACSSAVTRRWSDMHAPTWVGLMTANVVIRTLLFHPLELAICRKRVTRENDTTSVMQLMRAAWRGGKHATADARYPVYNLGRGGLRGFYRGVGVALIANLAGELIFCYVLEKTKERLERQAYDCARAVGDGMYNSGSNNSNKDDSKRRNEDFNGAICDHDSGVDVNTEKISCTVSGYAAALGAMYADLICIALITPLVVVANKQMTASYGMASQNHYYNMWNTFGEIWRTHTHIDFNSSVSNMRASRAGRWRVSLPHWRRIAYGVAGLYRGSSVGLLRVPSFGVWWAIYVTCKAVFYETAESMLPCTWEKSTIPYQHSESTSLSSSHKNTNCCTVAPLLVSASSTLHSDVVTPASSGHAASTELKEPSDSADWMRCPKWLTSATDNPVINASAAICASVLTTLMFNPLAVVQTRQQTLRSASYMNGHGHETALAQKKLGRVRGSVVGALLHRMMPFRRVYDIAFDLHKKEGMRGFYKGARANVYSSVLDGIVFSTFFELIKLGSDNNYVGA